MDKSECMKLYTQQNLSHCISISLSSQGIAWVMHIAGKCGQECYPQGGVCEKAVDKCWFLKKSKRERYTEQKFVLGRSCG